MGPIIYLNDASKYTLAVGLTIFRGAYSTQMESVDGCINCYYGATNSIVFPGAKVF